jgi:hypothetical protein
VLKAAVALPDDASEFAGVEALQHRNFLAVGREEIYPAIHKCFSEEAERWLFKEIIN